MNEKPAILCNVCLLYSKVQRKQQKNTEPTGGEYQDAQWPADRFRFKPR